MGAMFLRIGLIVKLRLRRRRHRQQEVTGYRGSHFRLCYRRRVSSHEAEGRDGGEHEHHGEHGHHGDGEIEVHGHHSLRLRSGSPRVGRILSVSILILLLGTIGAAIALRPAGPLEKAPGVVEGTVFVNGTVSKRTKVPCPSDYSQSACYVADVKVTSGPTKGDTATLQIQPGYPGAPDPKVGDDIRMAYFSKAPAGYEYTFDDYQRQTPMVALGLLFIGAVVVLGGFQGIRALIGMGLSLVAVVVYLLPALLRGGPTLPLALVTAIAVAFAALYLAHGIHVGTHVAFAGSVLALALTAGLGAAFISLCHFTGYSDEYAATLTVAAGHLDVRGLLLAGLVIGALGVLDDVTVTQVSAVAEVQAAAPHASALDLYRAGLRVGRDHVASSVNTLFLAYAGTSLPLLLLFSQGGRDLGGVLTTETVAVELMGALVGSIGLVAAVPITTGLAALVVHRPADRDEPSELDEPDDDAPPPKAPAAPEPAPRWDPDWHHDDDVDFWDRR
jgi:uncharacterized membrane protein